MSTLAALEDKLVDIITEAIRKVRAGMDVREDWTGAKTALVIAEVKAELRKLLP
jgi:hypothetical protein